MVTGVEGITEIEAGVACRGSLYQLLHSPSAYLNWHQLVGICLATAQGMLHLHSHQALHRDLKSGQTLPLLSVIIEHLHLTCCMDGGIFVLGVVCLYQFTEPLSVGPQLMDIKLYLLIG